MEIVEVEASFTVKTKGFVRRAAARSQMRQASSAEIPIVVEWYDDRYRAFDGSLWIAARDAAGGRIGLLGLERNGYGDVDATKGITADEAQQAVAARMADALIVDGLVWERTLGPRIEVQLFSEKPSKAYFKMEDAGGEDAKRSGIGFSAFDKEAVAEAYGRSYPSVGAYLDAPKVLSLEGWSLDAIRDVLHEETLRSELRTMQRIFARQAPTSVSRELVQQLVRVREVLEREEVPTEVLFYTANAVLAELPQDFDRLRLRSWVAAHAALQEVGIAWNQAAELNQFGIKA